MFECELTEKRFRELYGKLAKLLQQAQHPVVHADMEEKSEDNTVDFGASSNSIRVYRLCRGCVEQIRIIGVEKTKAEDQDIIII